MRYLISFLVLLTCIISKAQIPPSNVYKNLKVYKSVDVFEDGQQVPFNGIDYFYLNFDKDGDVWVISWASEYNQWCSSPATLITRDEEGSKYEGCNGGFENLVFLLSPDKQDILVAKEGSNLVVAYELENVATPNHNTSICRNSGSSFSGNSGTTTSGRKCISCGGLGKCKTCKGQGWYYHETGYYTGNTRKTKTTCPVCRGTGKCGTCHGSGTIR